MSTFVNKLLNNEIITDPTITYKCDRCSKCKSNYFIHMNIDNTDKYICSYLCSGEMEQKYGNNYWDNVVNIKDFQHPRPLQPKTYKPKEKFSVEYDYIDDSRNEFIQSLYEEDKRIQQLEQEYSELSSESDYDSE